MSGRACRGVQIVVIAKRPIAGQVKTRLIPRYGADGAAALAEAALFDTLDAVGAGPWARRWVALDGCPDGLLPAGFELLAQRGGGLDGRIAAACEDAFRAVPRPVLVIGADTPQVTPALLADAAAVLTTPGVDAVLGPAADGGYWLLGLRSPSRYLIEGVPMSQRTTGAAQLARLRDRGLRVRLLATLTDVDTPADVCAVTGAPGGRFAATVGALGSRELHAELSGASLSDRQQ
jgi:rSAM/selenodomain-associated transferase 1